MENPSTPSYHLLLSLFNPENLWNAGTVRFALHSVDQDQGDVIVLLGGSLVIG